MRTKIFKVRIESAINLDCYRGGNKLIVPSIVSYQTRNSSVSGKFAHFTMNITVHIYI